MNFAYDITERTLSLLSYAGSFANALHDYKITPEYLFMGALLNPEPDNTMRPLFARYGVDENKFYRVLFGKQADALQVRLRRLTPFDLPNLLYKLSGLATQIMGKAVHQLSGNRVLEPEDLILAILDEPRSVTREILQDLNVDVDLLHKDLEELREKVHSEGATGRTSDVYDENRYAEREEEQSSKSAADNHGDSKNLMSVNEVRKHIPTLLKYGKDMTKMAEDGKLDPVIGRQQELKRMVQILGRRMKNNPLLIGEPGVGKTAVVEALVQAINRGDVPHDLQKRVVIALDVVSLLAGASYQGEYEERLKKCLQEASDNKQVIIFIDEIHTLLTGEGNQKDTSRIGNVLKPLLARGDIQVIGATTSVEYRKYFSNDAALERRFMPITVNEPSEEDAIKIIQGLKKRYEDYHQIKITDEAINAAVKLSKRYLPMRFLPDKAIDLIDEAGSRLKLNAKEMENSVKNIKQSSSSQNQGEDNEKEKNEKQALAQHIESLKKELDDLAQAKQKACDKEDFEEAANCRQKELQKQSELKELECRLQDQAQKAYVLTAQDIAETLTDWTNIPINQLSEEENSRLRNLESELHKRVIGQDEAVKALAKAIRRGRVGLSMTKKPIGSFMFLGTTGVGKTELAKALAEVLFGDRNSLIRFDMSEYDSQMSATRLFGSAPGYVGYEEGGQLTEAVYKKPYSVVLLDEVEKAHPDIWNVFLQVLEDGRLTDGKGRLIDFSNTVIIMTSNIGANLLNDSQSSVGKIGFANKNETQAAVKLGDKPDYNGHTYEEAKKLVLNELRLHFNPEFLNRLDKIVFFEKLSMPAMRKIAKLMLKTLQANSRRIGYSLTYSENALNALTKQGYDPKYGARPLRRIIDGELQDLLVDLKLSEHAPKSAFLCLEYSDEEGFHLKEVDEAEYRELQEAQKKEEDNKKEAEAGKGESVVVANAENAEANEKAENKSADKSDKDAKSSKSAKSEDKTK